MEQGSNLSKEQLLAYIKKQKKAIAALTEDKAAKQVIIEDLKNEFASLEPKLRNRASAPPEAPGASASRVVELGRARDAALAEAEAAKRAALDADARAVRCGAAAGELEADKARWRASVGELERYVASVESKATKRAETPSPPPRGPRRRARRPRRARRSRAAKTHKAVADALEAAKAGAKAALETMRVEGDATREEAVAAAVDGVKAEAKARIQAVKDRLAQVQAFAKKRDEAAKAFEDAPADGRLEAAEEKVKLQVLLKKSHAAGQAPGELETWKKTASARGQRTGAATTTTAPRPPRGAATTTRRRASTTSRGATRTCRTPKYKRPRASAAPPAPPTPRRSPSPPPRDDGWGDDGWEDAADAPADAAADEPPATSAPPLKPRGRRGELERLRSQAAVYSRAAKESEIPNFKGSDLGRRSSAVATLERHLKRERDLRTSEDASDNVLFLKNSVVRFLCAKDDKEMQDMLGAMASILSSRPTRPVNDVDAAQLLLSMFAKPRMPARMPVHVPVSRRVPARSPRLDPLAAARGALVVDGRGTCLDRLQSLGAAKISRLQAYGIDTVEARRRRRRDYPMPSPPNPMDGAAEYAHTCSSSTWRLDAPSLSALRAAANAAGRLRVSGDGSVAAPPRCLVGEAVPGAAPAPVGGVAGGEALFTGWFEKQIQLLCGRGADRAGRLRRSDKRLGLDPMALALCAIFVAGKLEDEFVAAADLAAAVSPDDAAATALAAAVAAAEPAFLAGVRFDLRKPKRPRDDASSGTAPPAKKAKA
ncbi:hypothetical protein JL722_10947 [Aureococcus anophagefferens]|nr:hypothetical protein JL722_10947 [Aureococcus anophagefferens]